MLKSYAECIVIYFKIILPIKKTNAEKSLKLNGNLPSDRGHKIIEPSFCPVAHGLSVLSLSVCQCKTAAVKIVTPEPTTKCLIALTQPD